MNANVSPQLRNLAIHVLAAALRDLVSVDSQVRKDARRWMFSETHRSNFTEWLELAGIDAEYVTSRLDALGHGAVRAMIANRLGGDSRRLHLFLGKEEGKP